MALANDHRGRFEISDSAGTIDPEPPLVIRVDHDSVTCFSRGRDLNLLPQSDYSGIGKFSARISPQYRQWIDQVQGTLGSRAMPDRIAMNSGPILGFRFERQGHSYAGTYDFNYGEQFDNKISVLYSLARDLIAHGTPEVKIRPTLAMRSAADALVVDLTFVNEGAQDVIVDGPHNWSPTLYFPVAEYVQVGAIGQQDDPDTAGVGFALRLAEAQLSPHSRRYAQEIAVKAGQSARLEFVVPHSALTFDTDSTARHVKTGHYRVSGTTKFAIRAPSDMTGRVFTPIDGQTGIELRAPRQRSRCRELAIAVGANGLLRGETAPNRYKPPPHIALDDAQTV